MGTRSLTVMVEEGREVAVMYRQFDGYPTGHGAELKEYLLPMHLTNGIPLGQDPEFYKHLANGGACLFAQLLAHFKIESGDPDRGLAGGIYLYPAGTRDAGEEYVYTVTVEGSDIRLRVESKYRGTLYEGSVEGFDPDNAEKGEE